MTAELTPTRAWQALVPELQALNEDLGDAATSSPEAIAAQAADTAERLLLLVHYSIDWENSWIAQPKYRKNYWDGILPRRVQRATRRSATLEDWWSSPALQQLGLLAPGYPDRRRELAGLLREPPLPVLNAMRTSLPALLLRVRIITGAVSAERRAEYA
ncbi:hypothetical protein [Mycobacterium intracellulare]|uniref:hypothetical protein n=1 Tax=Mycobacterium intracellulare TaxID=1767 RepID=UPI001EEDEF83|nr:hypothetical protein [Mycobacterium intracellulare]MEE3755368.1 hypothetical protein [Mycobacterium intracellulare]